MSDLLVGSNACSYKDVSDILNASSVASSVQAHWKDIAVELNVGDELIENIQGQLLRGETHYPEVFYDILKRWRSIGYNKATLQGLIEVLEHLNLTNAAQALKSKFITTKVELRLKQHVYNHLRELVDQTVLSSLVSTRLLGMRVLTYRDVQYLESKPTPYERAEALYMEYIVKIPGAYDALIDVLRTEMQIGAATILERVYQE